jgi:hypothetical protein
MLHCDENDLGDLESRTAAAFFPNADETVQMPTRSALPDFFLAGGIWVNNDSNLESLAPSYCVNLP